MKIIYLANTRIPTEKGHGWQIMKMCETLAVQGQEIELLLPYRFNSIKESPFSFYKIKPLFKITKLPCFDQVYFNFISGKLAFWVQTITFLIAAKAYLIFKKYDILYTREAATGFFFSGHVLEIHSLPGKRRPLVKKTWQSARCLIAITNCLKQALVQNGVEEDKISVAPDAVDLKEFNLPLSKEEARQKLGLPTDKKIILYTGSFFLYDWKGADILLGAARLSSAGSLFVLVGGTKDEIAEIKKSAAYSNILLISHQPHYEIPLYLKAADVLVLPNKSGNAMSEKYTSPLKLFEYMASGRPIVASDLPSIREVLNENNAVLVEPNSPEKLAQGIEKIFIDSDLCDKIFKQAYLDVQNYTWEKRAEKILKFITSV